MLVLLDSKCVKLSPPLSHALSAPRPLQLVQWGYSRAFPWVHFREATLFVGHCTNPIFLGKNDAFLVFNSLKTKFK